MGYGQQVRELSYMHARGITYATLYQGPYEESARYRDFMGWEMPWYSAPGSLGTLLVGRRVGIMHVVCYLRGGTESSRPIGHGRGVEAMDYSYGLIDLTVYGRQEEWEDSPAGWPQSPVMSHLRTNGRPTAQWSRLEAGRSGRPWHHRPLTRTRRREHVRPFRPADGQADGTLPRRRARVALAKQVIAAPPSGRFRKSPGAQRVPAARGPVRSKGAGSPAVRAKDVARLWWGRGVSASGSGSGCTAADFNYELPRLEVGLLGRPGVEAALEAYERFPSCLELNWSEPLSDLLRPFGLSALDCSQGARDRLALAQAAWPAGELGWARNVRGDRRQAGRRRAERFGGCALALARWRRRTRALPRRRRGPASGPSSVRLGARARCLPFQERR